MHLCIHLTHYCLFLYLLINHLALLSLLTTGVSALGISAGGFHTCAVLNEGTVMCWGSNSNGQLGIGSTTGTLSPIAAHLGEGVLQFHN